MSASKLSEYETGRFRPTAQHIESFCRVYGTGPEELGLIVWRTDAERTHAADAYRTEIEREIRAGLDAALLIWI